MNSAGLEGAELRAETTDSDDIRWALETATAMLSKGDYPEALRWLRRAAETASEEGADVRAVQLAKAAAELRGRLAIPGTEPPPPVAPVAAVAPSAAAPSANDEVFERAAQALLQKDNASNWSPESPREAQADTVRVSQLPTRPSLRAVAAEPDAPARPSRIQEARATRPSWPSPKPDAAREPTNRRSYNPPPPVPRTSESNAPAKAAVAAHQALRVAVSPTADGHGLVVAKVLAAGERPPPGTKEALFVALEPGVDLLAR